MKSVAKEQKNILENTKKNILETARRLFSEFSYFGVSMNDIAKKLNITKAALYYHFSGKREIYIKVIDEVFNNLRLALSQALKEKTTDKKFYKIIKNYLDFGLKEKNLIRVLMLKFPSKDAELKKYIFRLREGILDLAEPVVKKILAEKKKSKKIESRLTTSLLIGMIEGILLEYSFFNKKIDSKKIAKQVFALIAN